MKYSLNLGQWNSIFAVPSALVDKHIKLATEAQLKVILYILRNSHASSTADISSALNISEDEVENAVGFWMNRGLIREADGQLTPGVSDNTDTPAKVPRAERNTAVSRAVRPDSAFVTKILKSDANLSGLMEEAQAVLKKPLSPGDIATLVMLYDSFGLPCEVLAMLLNYAVSVGNANMRFVERTGISWSDNGVFTVEAAEREIERLAQSKEAWGRVSALFGLHNSGNATKAQLSAAERWLYTWRFTDDMIVEAYERCVNAKGEYNMSYINGILKKWYEKRILNLDDLKKYESAGAKKPSSKTSTKQRGSVFSADSASFDLSKYEKQSLFDD